MDLLAGYGSDASDSGSEEQPAPSTATPAPSPATEAGPAAPPPRARPRSQDDAFGAAFGGGLGRVPGFGGLPAPGAPANRTKRMVSFMAPLKPLSKEELEEEQTKKKLKPSGGNFDKSGFLTSLPPPKNSAASDSSSGGRVLGGGSGVLGSGGTGLDLGNGISGHRAQASSPMRAAAGQAASGAIAEAPIFHSNDAYRVDNDSDSPAQYVPAAMPYEYAGTVHAENSVYQQPAAPLDYGGDTQYVGPALTKALPRQDGEEMLRAAMAAERNTAAKRTEDPFADLGVSFKEVDQAKLTYQDPSQKEAISGVRGALGKAYEQQLRAEADAVAPDKLSKRKHQINSLYHAAKMKELELLERRGTSLKTKAETQAKYGW